MIRLLSFVLLFSLPQWLYAQDIPDFSATYMVDISSLPAGELQRSLTTNDDGTRVFRAQSKAVGTFTLFLPDQIDETSVWKLVDNEIQPQTYLYQRTGGEKDKTLSLDFDWQADLLFIDDRKHPWQLKLEPNTLDKLVYQLALISDLADNKTTFNYIIADGGKLKTYNIKVLGQEIINTSLGAINTVKLTRVNTHANSRQITLWCAPALNYLPVRLQYSESEDIVFTARLQQLSGISTENAFQPVTKTPQIQ